MFSRDVEIKKLLTQVRELAQQDRVSPTEFIQEFQLELEREPGAHVSLATRDLSYLKEHGYLSDRPDLTLEEQQAALKEASSDFDEGNAIQDAFTEVMDRELDRIAPRSDDPEPM